jgi:hypothetical protein
MARSLPLSLPLPQHRTVRREARVRPDHSQASQAWQLGMDVPPNDNANVLRVVQ